MSKRAAIIVTLLALSGARACTSDQLHGVGEAWRYNQCGKEVGRNDRAACKQFDLGSR